MCKKFKSLGLLIKTDGKLDDKKTVQLKHVKNYV